MDHQMKGDAMRRQLAIALTFAMALSVVLPAFAEMSARERANLWFQQRDQSGDGFLTVEEVVLYEFKLFERMDSRGEGKLSEAEYCIDIPAELTANINRCRLHFAAIDTNDDDYITPDEIATYLRLVFQAADQNGDGKVSLGEWAAFLGPQGEFYNRPD
jgi:hypothetical protein